MNYSLESLLDIISDPVVKVMAKSAYNFHMKYGDGGEKGAYEKGFSEIKRHAKLIEDSNKEEVFVDLSTGKHFVSTEAEMESKFG